jgi:SAM-dependent methyltransferase
LTVPSLDAEYSSLSPLQIRIDTHRRHSQHPDDLDRAVTDALQLAGSEYLVDVGCGTGDFLAHLVEHGHRGRLVGIDKWQPGVAAAACIPGVEAMKAPAEQLPLTNGEVDVLTAKNMLYHLPDPTCGLEEFRRVTRPGGMVCVVVNHPDTCPRIREVVARHAAARGLAPAAGMTNGVDSDTAPDMLHDVFGNTLVRRYDNTLIFTTPDPLVRFAAAVSSFCGVAPEHPDKDAILADVETELRDWFAAEPGRVWRDPKGYTVLTATR